ncbi:MAG: hypothetical protein R2769_14350 [Saprospiraceae bacterium]
MEYRPGDIEARWKKQWEETQLYKVENKSDKPKYYFLDMFPYPSGQVCTLVTHRLYRLLIFIPDTKD